MAQQSMPQPEAEQGKTTLPPVPIIGGTAKSLKIKVRPLITGADGKVYHTKPYLAPSVFPAIDNDLAMENLVNDFDMTAADMQDL